MNLPGIDAFHGDSSAVLLKGRCAMCWNRGGALQSHQALGRLPAKAIESVLALEAVALDDVEHVAISPDPKAHLVGKALFVLRRQLRQGPDLAVVLSQPHVPGVEKTHCPSPHPRAERMPTDSSRVAPDT